ncbi:hypothetical protein IV102_23085 [bacterium]|nr:hypothetical protein [bacterium]
MKKKLLGAALLTALVGPPALAQRIYVAVEDLAKATGGTYNYDSTTHVMQATIPKGGAPRGKYP